MSSRITGACGVMIFVESFLFKVVGYHYLWRILDGSNEESVVIYRNDNCTPSQGDDPSWSRTRHVNEK